MHNGKEGEICEEIFRPKLKQCDSARWLGKPTGRWVAEDPNTRNCMESLEKCLIAIVFLVKSEENTVYLFLVTAVQIQLNRDSSQCEGAVPQFLCEHIDPAVWTKHIRSSKMNQTTHSMYFYLD